MKTKSLPLKNLIWAKPALIHRKTFNNFSFKEVTVVEVFKYLKNLSRKKSCGSDNLSPGILKDAALQIAKPLCHVINTSLKTSIIPSDFKLGTITPIHKSGSKQEMDNYRPITVLPVCSKILEKCIHKQLLAFLEEHNLLSCTQFGYRKNRNTELAATLLVDDIRRNMDKGEVTGSIFIDLSKAFDTLTHAQIIESLSSCGVTGTEKELFVDYLFNRKQVVRIEKEISPPEPVTCGVPQGSILGPLLFLVAFNDIGSTLRHCKIITYADDTVIYTSGKSKEEVQELLQEDFKSIADWLELNDLVMNFKKGKTECILFGTARRVRKSTLEIKYRHHIVSTTNSYKYLGVLLDQTLSLRDHIEEVYKKAASRLYLLKRVRPQLTTEAALSIYKTMLIPIFTYCSILTGNPTKSFETKIMNMENRVRNIVFNGIVPKDLRIVSVKELTQKKICLQVFNIINGNTCANFKNYFEIMNNNTRNKNYIIRLPKIKLEVCRKSFFFNGGIMYNNLPKPIRSAATQDEFLKFYRDYFNV